MQSDCISHTQLPGTSALFADYLYHFDKVARFYSRDPHDPDSLRRSALAVDYPDSRRATLVAALRKLNGDSAQLADLELPGTVAVVTGQQVGLFSGPAYTIYKALSAAKLARELSASGIRAVPVFWLATEDHDLAEVDHCWVYGRDKQPVELRLSANGGGSTQRPVGSLPIQQPPVDALRMALAGSLYADEIVTLVEEAYRPGVTLGDAFRHLLQRLLAGYGLIFIDPLDEGIRRLAAPLLATAVSKAPELSVAVAERSRQLTDAGYHAQVHFEEHTSFFFLLENGRRLPLRRKNGEYFQEGRRISAGELAARADHLSPNALLRPVLQDYLLPTAAYVGGPAELAYLAQSQVLYQELLGRVTLPLPRSGFTLIDERAKRLLHQYRLQLSDCFEGEVSLREKIAAKLIPPAVENTINEVASSVASQVARLEHALQSYDPTLAEAMVRSKAKIAYQVEKIRGKAAREALRRETRVEEGVAHLNGLLYPKKHLQERFYSILPFLADHGLELLDTIYDNVHTGCVDHHVMTV